MAQQRPVPFCQRIVTRSRLRATPVPCGASTCRGVRCMAGHPSSALRTLTSARQAASSRAAKSS